MQSWLDGGQAAVPPIAHRYGDLVEIARAGSPSAQAGDRGRTAAAPAARSVQLRSSDVVSEAAGACPRCEAEGAQIFPPSDSAEERHARSIGDRVRRAPGSVGPLVTGEADETALSAEGRRHFRPFVGDAVDRARIHVDARAEQLAGLARARALTYGRDVFIPRAHWSPVSADGRALLGHELAHVTHAQAGAPRLFRDGEVEPHYPTVDEQVELEKAMGREFHAVPPAAAPAEGPVPPPVLKQGDSLTPEKRVELARDLMGDFYTELDKLKPSDQEVSRAPTISDDAAYASVERARAAVYERFGAYASRNVTLTRDETKTTAERAQANQILVVTGLSEASARALARTITTTHCAPCRRRIDKLDKDSRDAVVAIVVSTAMRERGAELRSTAALRVGGSHSPEGDRIRINPRASDAFSTAVHEVIHALAHPAFRIAFGDNDNINEGFTDYFARQITRGTSQYDDPVSTVKKVNSAVTGPFLLATVGGASAEESLRRAYFRGRLDLIGWRARTKEEAKAVAEAGGSGEWDPAEARRHADRYRADVLAAQGAKRNILGIGLFFGRESDHTISVRYARVLARTEYARGQLVAEGQVFGSPGRDPRTLGGALGIAAEYQEPHFYVTGGVRLVGSAALSGDSGRIDFAPFAGIGVRPWQRIRVGVESFVLLPLGDGEPRIGGGGTVSVEF